MEVGRCHPEFAGNDKIFLEGRLLRRQLTFLRNSELRALSLKE